MIFTGAIAPNSFRASVRLRSYAYSLHLGKTTALVRGGREAQDFATLASHHGWSSMFDTPPVPGWRMLFTKCSPSG